MTCRRLVVGLLFLLILLPCVFAGDFSYRVFLEEPLVSIDQSLVPDSFKISSNGMRYAYIINDKKRFKVIVDGKEHRSYEDIANLCFTPDGNHLAYIAKRDNRYFLVYDGVEGKGYDRIIDSSFSISSDSNHYAYVAKTGDKWLVVTEASEEKAYEEIGSSLLSFSPDSQSLAYTARIADKWILVVNGHEGKAYDEISSLKFSQDGNRIAAVVRIDSFFSVLVDDVEGPPFAMVKPESLVFSPDIQQIGYIAVDQGREFIVVNHQVSKAYDRIISKQLSFTPDSGKIAFAAQLQETKFVVFDGVEGKPYVEVMETPPVFNYNGRSMAYAAYNGTNWLVILDGVEQDGYSNIGKGSLLFSNRGSRLAYTAKTDDGTWTVVVDGLAGRYYDDIGLNSLTFSPDGKNLVYSARQGNKWLVVLDNQEGRPFDGIITGGNEQIRFNGSAFFYYSALDGNKVVSIQERIASKSDFVDFQKPSSSLAETQVPLDLPTEEFKFQFNPSDGITFIETTKITDFVEVETMNQQFYDEEIKIRTQINKSSNGYLINYLILQYQVDDYEDPAGGEALSALEGVEFATILDSNGVITGFKGLDNFEKKLKTIPSKHYRKYKEHFTKEAVAQRLKNGWKASVENFNGKSFRLGDVWNTSVKIPLPNGETSDVSVAFQFKEKTVIGSVPCILIQIDYDLSSSNLKRFFSEIIMKGVPQVTTEPEVDISCVGNSILNPDTLLGYASQMKMIMKASIEVPELGKKEFIFKRNIDVSCEYLN